MCVDDAVPPDISGPSILRFEAKWLKEAQFQQVVQRAWEQADSGIQTNGLAGKLAVVHAHLHKWDRSVLQSRKRKIVTSSG